ncbi:SDR family oxidoreductase [Marinihelvus fidelis]|uniref:SDR family oxidoreductase n=1 Tax=Marinihelvus fidelis TaxID=2613842 RepID=A0A5N0T612_9GAMM|nr:SDR family oxidoreductase [Marinihelvus fidelis]KAA9130500.1 SDR family oxidoreductase [Marinihelvus fidelis]
MNSKPSKRVAIVTGGSRDIGRAIAEKMAAEGVRVVINFHGSAERAKETLNGIQAVGGEATIVKGDMTSYQDVQTLVSTACETYGDEIHYLINVVGGLVSRRTLLEMSEGFFEEVMKLNMTSTFLVTRAVVPHMPSGSAVVNFASQAGRDGGGPGAAAYAASKGAVMAFTRSMAKELGPQGIRVNALCPGMIDTTFHDTFTRNEVRKNVAAATPLRREGDVSDIAEATWFLASQSSEFITGACVDINGGMYFS